MKFQTCNKKNKILTKKFILFHIYLKRRLISLTILSTFNNQKCNQTNDSSTKLDLQKILTFIDKIDLLRQSDLAKYID